MVAWLEKILYWFYNRCTSEGRYDVYQPKERAIYSYFNGQEVLRIDPITLYKKLMEIGPELDIDIKVANSESKDAAKAQAKVIERIRWVFSVKSLEEGGLTEDETAGLLDHYLRFTDQVKKNLNYLGTSWAPSVASEPPLAANPVTSNSSDCGCAGSAVSTSKATSSPSEPAWPSV